MDDVPVDAAEVAAELARLRAGRHGPWLPADGTAEGRQFRREVTQRVVLRALLERSAGAAGEPASVRPDPALVGSAAADVLAGSAPARAVYATVTAAVTVTEDDLHAAYAGDPERYRSGERWTLRQAFDPAAPDGLADRLATAPAQTVPVEVLLPEVVAAARAGGSGPVRSALGWHLVDLVEVLPAGPVPFAAVRDDLAAVVLDRRRQRTFARWLDAEYGRRIRLAHGYEHPADPAQPDATHRH